MTPERRYFYLSVTETATAVACLPVMTVLIAYQNEWTFPDPDTDAGFPAFMIILALLLSSIIMLRNAMRAWDRVRESEMEDDDQ